jgi:hypothetical protein
MPWYIQAIISLSFTLLVAFLVYGYRWMDSVKDNHLSHIQESTRKAADVLQDVKLAIELHDAHEQAHYDSLTKILEWAGRDD